MSNSSNNDLSSLINQAENQVEKRQERSPKRAGPSMAKPIFSLILVVLVVFSLLSIRSRFASPTPEVMAHDLETVIDAARMSIEAAKEKTGELPDAIPNASLASIVSYDHERNQYQLTATIMGIRVTLEPNGKKTTDIGVQQ